MPTSPPRTRLSSSGESRKRSRPAKRIRPSKERTFSGSSLRMERASVDFPHPDSPAIPRDSPAATSKDAPRTARTALSPRRYVTDRFSIWRRGFKRSLLHPRVQHVAEAFAEEVEGQDRNQDGQAGEQGQPPGDVDVVLARGEHVVPGGRGRLHAQPQKRKRG